jgi:hypothetical protein
LGQLLWKYRTNGQVPGLAVDRSGHVFTGATFTDPFWSNEVYITAINRDGTPFWRRKVTPYEWGFSQGVDSWPAINLDGSVVVNSTNSELLKFSNAGIPFWTVHRSNNTINDSAIAILPDQTLAHYQHIGGLRKMRADGSTIWETAASSQSSVAVAGNGEMALGGVRTQEPHGSRDITYFNSFGAVQWYRNSTHGANIQAMIGPDGVVYYYGMSARSRIDGSVIWSASAGSPQAMSPNGKIVYGVSGTSVNAVDASSGTILWNCNTTRNLNLGLAVDSQNRIFATSADGHFISISSAGVVQWDTAICHSFKTPPVIGSHGQAYASGRDTQYEDFHVYAIH